MTINALDPSQKHTLKSIVAGTNEGNISLVYGPPGTGKSQLLVSLLFELAASNKKVLFVSQNTEALEVIERMITGLDKDMGLKEDDLSLKDFCLRLYTREHRYLKYIRAQSARLSARAIPQLDTYGLADVADHAYKLNYVHLDRAQNYTVDASNVGIDELLKYFLQYVDSELVVEVLHNFDKVDIRKALSSLDAYEYPSEFSYYNQPQNELRYITTTNHSVSLSDIQAGVQRAESIVSQLSSAGLKVKQTLDVNRYLDLIIEYIALQGQLNLFRIHADNIDVNTMRHNLSETLVQVRNLIEEDSLIGGLEMLSEPLFKDSSQIRFLDSGSISDYERALDELVKTTESFRRTDKELLNFEIKDILFSLLKNVEQTDPELFKRVPDLLECDAAALESVINDTVAYSKRNKIERLIKQLPDSYKLHLPNARRGDVDLILAYIEHLGHLVGLLGSTDIKVKTYDQLTRKALQYRQAVNLFDKIGASKVALLANKLLINIELTRSHGLEKLSTLRDLENHAKSLLADVEVYKTVVMANKSKVIHLSSDDLVKAINLTVKHNLAKAALISAYDQYGRYLTNSSTVDEFLRALPDNIDLIKRQKNTIESVCMSFALPADFTLDNQVAHFKGLTLIIDDLKKNDLYSHNFFVMEPDLNIVSWFNKVKNIRHFHNLEELDNYLAHNRFINEMKTALRGNESWLNEMLQTPGVTYYDFASRLVNSLARTSFQNLPSSQRKIMPADFFQKYEAKLKNDRKVHYIEGLRHLARQTASSARSISNPNNWLSGISTMEKIRNNTASLKEVFPITIATPKEVAKYVAPTKEIFDYVIFDEASQLLPGQALPAIYRSKEAVIIGDPHQMPPTLLASVGSGSNFEEQDDLDTSDSILDMVKNMQPDSQYHLKVHYRSESNKLFQPSHEAIYAQDGIQSIYEAQMFNAAPIAIADNLGAGLDQTGQYDKNFRNIVTGISEYLESDPSATFCVLFLRAEDLHSFKDYLATYEAALGKIYKLYSENKILVSTITNCQGIEGTYSILYFRHYPSSPSGMWFFRESAGAYKRLNVAITRQRRGLSLLLADPKEKWLQVCEAKIENNETPPNTRKSAELLRALLNSAGEIVDTEYLDRHLSANSLSFESPLIEQMYNMLCKHYKLRIDNDMKIYCGIGWHMPISDDEKSVGANHNIGFRIDIGIYSMSKKKFVLGIEMDDSAYHSAYDREHSDYERIRTLKIKGWDLYRVWSTNWLNGQTTELLNLVKKIDKAL